MGSQIDWLRAVFEIIETRSFSSVWYWMAVAVVWSTVSHFVLGVPFDMLIRARRRGGQAERDFEDMVRINVNRYVYVDATAGAWLIGAASFLLTGLATLGFFYSIQFAQAIFLIAAPLTAVGLMTLATARELARQPLTGEALRRRIVRHRFWVQLLGMIAIFLTALWGMYKNLSVGLLYG